jgi:hypothetical protein
MVWSVNVGWAEIIEKVIERVKKMCLLDIVIPYTDTTLSEEFRGGELA